MWRCQCECGNEIVVRGDSLRSGHTKSCGCLQKEKVSKLNFIDLTGKKFGRWTVKGPGKRRETNSGLIYWICDCECGTKNKEVNGRHLKDGTSRSCGCVKSHGEEKISRILSENKILFEREFLIKELTMSTGGSPRFDFAILNKDKTVAYFIEYNGEQHYNSRGSIFTKETVKTIQIRDEEKKEYCKQNNIPLIIINYKDFDKIDLNWIYFPEYIK